MSDETKRGPWPYTTLELNSPGIRPPLDWRRVMDTVEALNAALGDASMLRAAITQALGQLGQHYCSDADSQAAIAETTLRAALSIPEGP